MAGSANGYISLEALRGVKMPEADVEVDGIGKFRVRALTQEQVRLANRAARIGGTEGLDGNLWRQHQVAHGLITPDVSSLAVSDIDEAITIIQAMHPAIVQALDTKISEITYVDTKELKQHLFTMAGSRDESADMASDRSNSARS